MQSTRMRAVPAGIFPNVALYVSSSPTVKGTAGRDAWARISIGRTTAAEAASVVAIVRVVRVGSVRRMVVVPPSRFRHRTFLPITRDPRENRLYLYVGRRQGISTCGLMFFFDQSAVSAGVRGRLVQLTNLTLALADDVEKILRERDGFLLRVRPKKREPADDLLGLGERPVLHRDLARLLPHAEPERTRQASLGAEEVAGVGEFLDERAH